MWSDGALQHTTIPRVWLVCRSPANELIFFSLSAGHPCAATPARGKGECGKVNQGIDLTVSKAASLESKFETNACDLSIRTAALERDIHRVTIGRPNKFPAVLWRYPARR